MVPTGETLATVLDLAHRIAHNARAISAYARSGWVMTRIPKSQVDTRRVEVRLGLRLTEQPPGHAQWTYPGRVSVAWGPEPDVVHRATELLTGGEVLVLTGAGVSTDSGIPDYRGPHRVAVPTPMTIQQLRSGPEALQRYWARAHLGWARMGQAAPNVTHHTLVRWQQEGRLAGLITQNVDGLHEKAGHRDVVDLHGRVDRVVCMDCGDLTPRADVQARHERLNPGWSAQTAVHGPDGDVQLDETSHFVVAPCRVCGGRLRPDVVFFGDSVPTPVVERCFARVEQARSLLVLGSSLQVMSGLRFVRRAAALGRPVVIVNRGETRGDHLATVRIDAGCAPTVQHLTLAWT